MSGRKIKDRRVVQCDEFPTSLDGRLNSILSSVNTETKQVELILLEKEPKTSWTLKREFDKATGLNFDFQHNRMDKYCTCTFIPIGMVCEEKVIYDGHSSWVKAFSLTEAGEVYGKSIAAFTLRKANEYNKSFFEFLGQTTSKSDSRSPYNRTKILELLSANPLRITDVSEKLKIDKTTVLDHLNKLKSLGFVKYKSINTGGKESGWSRYKWVEGKNPEDVEPFYRFRLSIRNIAKLFRELEKSDYREVTEKSGYARLTVSLAISALQKQGFIERVGKFSGGEKLSEINITKEGGHFLEDYYWRVLDALDDGNDLNYMKDILAHYEREPELFMNHAVKGISMYLQVSPRMNSKQLSKRCKEVYNLIKPYPEGLTPKDVDELMGVRSTKTLRELLHNDLVYKEGKGHDTVYKAK